MQDSHSISKISLLHGLVLVLFPTGLQAQGNVLEEVIVTAQKRVENVQEIPVTINVVTGEALDIFAIRNTNDLANSVPGLVIQATPQNLSQITVRGLGTGAGGESLDQSVGLFIDGVWAGRLREFQAALFDVQRVEVIKGTQSTLLGKNTSLGAISILSRRPGDEFEGYIHGNYEFEYESTYATGAINLPTDYGNYRVAFNRVDEEGYVYNKSTGNKVPEREQSTIRVSAEYDVTENGNLLLSYQYDDLKIHGDTFQPDNDESGFIAGLDPSADIGINKIKNAWTSYGGSGDADDKQDSQRALVQYDHAFGEYQLTSLTGWSKYNNDRLTDSDFLSVDYLTTTYNSDYEQTDVKGTEGLFSSHRRTLLSGPPSTLLPKWGAEFDLETLAEPFTSQWGTVMRSTTDGLQVSIIQRLGNNGAICTAAFLS